MLVITGITGNVGGEVARNLLAAGRPVRAVVKLDGLVYARISESAADAKTRLGWLSRMNRFTLQPYQQLAKVLREAGDASGSGQVLFEMEDQLRRQKVRPCT
jgi:nucleoside-diphosphate-sugar epimerase